MFDYVCGLSDCCTEGEITGAEIKAALLGYYHKLASGEPMVPNIYLYYVYQSSAEPLYNKPDLCYSLGSRKRSLGVRT